MENIEDLNKKLNEYKLINEALEKRINLYEISSKLDYEKIIILLNKIDECNIFFKFTKASTAFTSCKVSKSF